MCTTKTKLTNFSEEEKFLLAELGHQFPEIENKRYDSYGSLKKKERAWKAVLEHFNSANPRGNQRDFKILQGC